jgi:hypothetical protein
MIGTNSNLAQAVDQAVLERRNLCDKTGTHIVADDLTHACSHSENTGEIDVLVKDNVFYKRCNLPFCPLKSEINNHVAAIRS